MSVRAGKSFDKLLDDPNWKDRALKAEKQLEAVRVARYRWKHSLVSDLDSRYWQALNACGDDIDAAIGEES